MCTRATGTHNCDPQAECVNTKGGFKCRCLNGFVGDGISCSDVDECEGDNALSLCDANAFCKNTIGL